MNDMNKTCLIFASYSESNRNNSFINTNNKFESGIKSSFFSNRVGLDIAYYYNHQNVNINTIDLDTENWINLKYKIANQGVEIKNSIKILHSRRTHWEVTSNFSWNNAIYSDINDIDNYSELIKSYYPEFRYSFSSDFSYKSISIGLLFDGLNNQFFETYNYIIADYSTKNYNSIYFRQLNITYKYPQEKLSKKYISMFALSLYLKNAMNIISNPSHGVSENFYYGTSGSHVIGINLRLGF